MGALQLIHDAFDEAEPDRAEVLPPIEQLWKTADSKALFDALPAALVSLSERGEVVDVAGSALCQGSTEGDRHRIAAALVFLDHGETRRGVGWMIRRAILDRELPAPPPWRDEVFTRLRSSRHVASFASLVIATLRDGYRGPAQVASKPLAPGSPDLLPWFERFTNHGALARLVADAAMHAKRKNEEYAGFLESQLSHPDQYVRLCSAFALWLAPFDWGAAVTGSRPAPPEPPARRLAIG